MSSIAHRGRPRGQNRQALQAWVTSNGEFTMGQLARSLNMDIKAANDAIRRARDAQELRVVGQRSIPGAKRPVAVYSRSDVDASPVPLSNLLKVWS